MIARYNVGGEGAGKQGAKAAPVRDRAPLGGASVGESPRNLPRARSRCLGPRVERVLMKFSNLKVGTRLGIGFAVLLVACLSVGGIGWLRLAQLDAVVNRITTRTGRRRG